MERFNTLLHIQSLIFKLFFNQEYKLLNQRSILPAKKNQRSIQKKGQTISNFN